MRFLVDTNVISETRKRERANANVLGWFRATPPNQVGTSILVLAEIRRGIELKRRSDRVQATALDRWYMEMRMRLANRVLPVDEPVAEAWATLGLPSPLPLIDGLLAATASVHGLTLVTRNVADVARLGIPVLDPFAG